MSGAFRFLARPLEEEQRDGSYQVVLDRGEQFALVRWSGDSWAFSSGAALDFEPTHYLPRPE